MEELPVAVRRGLPTRGPEALAAFFDRYFERVHGYLRRLARSDDLAEDLTQDVFLHIHRALPRYDPERPLGPWVFTIASNKLRDHWRSRRVQEDRRIVSVDDDDASVALAAPAPRGAEELEARERDAAIAAAIAELPDMLQQTFVLRYYERLSFAEIGEVVQRNETAVRQRYSRALAELRSTLSHLVQGAEDA